jgi:dTDP-4-dehydrorhamnose 3,5-epimerase
MKFSPLPLKDAMLVEFAPRGDARGSFTRVFCADTLEQNNIFGKPVKHINHSVTAKAGTIRGLHYQRPPALEAKLFRCLRGALFDVMIDLRKGSPTFIQTFTITLALPGEAVFVPEGFAHGFQTLEDNTEAMYMTTAPYAPEHEGAIRYDDPLFKIQWPQAVTEISDRDKVTPDFDRAFRGL